MLLRPPKAKKSLPSFLTVEQAGALVEAPIAAPAGAELREAAMFEVLYGCGLRVSECVGLDLGDIEADVRARARRQGAQGSRGAARREGAARDRALAAGAAGARARRRRAVRQRARAAADGALGAPLPRRARRRRRRCRRPIRTRCATRTRRISWRRAPTCAPSRSCSATRRSKTTARYAHVDFEYLARAYENHPLAGDVFKTGKK